MPATIFSGNHVKALKNKLDLNGDAVLDGSAVSANTVVISDASKNIKSSAVSTTELGYLTGVSAAIQTQIDGKLAVTGGTINGDLAVTGNILAKNELRLEDPDGGTNYVAFKASTAQSADHTYTVPTAYPTADGQALVATTAGAMSWTTVGGGGAPTSDVNLTTFSVTASVTNDIHTLDSSINSAHIIWSCRNTVSNTYQAGNSIALKENGAYELINTIAGTASFGGANLTITSGGILRLVSPSVSGTFKFRIFTT